MTTAASTSTTVPLTAAANPAAPRAGGEPRTAFDTVKQVLKPIASLRLTVLLLSMSILLVFAGTSAQKELGIGDVLDRYFYAWWCWVPFKYLFPLSSVAWANLGGGFFFPGGYVLIYALLINLLSAHTVRFKFNWKRSGVLLIHFGLVLLLVGELLTAYHKREDQITFREGETRQWAHTIHDRRYELAVVDPSPAAHDATTVVGNKFLKVGQTVQLGGDLPFDVRIDQWYQNAGIAGPMQREGNVQRLATSGSDKDLGLIPMGKFTGVEAENVDTPGAFVTLIPKGGGEPFGTYLVSTRLSNAQDISVNGKRYTLALRFERTYLPYTLTLLDFTHDKYQGTTVARNFASRVRLDDPTNGTSREVTIRMNEPLRYAGRTFFQSGFDPEDDTVTTLQVVDNPAWTMPYIACVIGTIGMTIHFGMHLVGFLRKRKSAAAPVAAPVATPLAGRAPEPGRTPGKKRKAAALAEADDRSYTLPASGGFLSGLRVPATIVTLFALYVLSHVFIAPRAKEGQPDVYALGKVPVSFDGRTMPLDTLARSGLKIIHGKQSFKVDEGTDNERRVPAVQWLADVMAGVPRADTYRVFRIDHPQIKSVLGLDELVAQSRSKPWRQGDPLPMDGKNFSFEDVLLAQPGNGQKLQEQVDQAKRVPDKRRDLYQRKVMELYQHLSLHLRLAQAGDVLSLYDVWGDPKAADAARAQIEAAMAAGPDALTPDQRALMNRFQRMQQQVRRLQMMEQDPDAKTEDLYFVPPQQPGGAWGGLGQTLMASSGAGGGPLEGVPQEMTQFLGLLRDYRDGNAASFNANVATYAQQLGASHPGDAGTSRFEAFFNRFDPFFISYILYIATFVFVLISWVGFRTPMWRSAAGLLLLALVVHTAGLVMRVMISGRPPVTNLYSSAVFIAWGAVVMAACFEWVFRNGLGIACAAVVGALSLQIAGGLATEGDTMKQLQAVLDTNFWLATHVVVITLGYAATFLAMALAVVYVIGGMATPHVDADLRKNLVRMVYGVLCFAMLFSFVGTILGGIWADQSWGRFWGWDPKENGAVLIVLWVALILHARWGGLAKERGVMLLTILGGVVTGWSWFGTNMMGVGLHSYGFMERGVFWLALFTLVDLTIVGVALAVPQRMWWSTQQSERVLANRSGGRGFAPLPKA